MKTIITLALVTLLSLPATNITAQETNTNNNAANPWHVRSGYLSLNGGNYGSLAFTLHFENRWAGFVGFTAGSLESKNVPKDYEPGVIYLLSLPITESVPADDFASFDVGMGKILTKPSSKAWIMATAALNFCRFNEVEFTRDNSYPSSVPDAFIFFGIAGRSSNYTTEMNNKLGVGATLGLQANVNVFRNMGIGAGANVQLNSAAVIPGGWLGLNFGVMRPKKVHHRKA